MTVLEQRERELRNNKLNKNKNRIIKGEKAIQYLFLTLKSMDSNGKYRHPLGESLKGYYVDSQGWVAFDNTSDDCWVEAFESDKACLEWLSINKDITW